MMIDIVNNFTTLAPYLEPNSIIDIHMGIKSSTGEKICRVKTYDNKIFIKKIAVNGIVSTEYIEIPSFNSSSERDELIVYLKQVRNLIQDDIADYLGISQSTVSNTLRSKGIS